MFRDSSQKKPLDHIASQEKNPLMLLHPKSAFLILENGKITACSDAASMMIDIPKSEILNHHPAEFSPELQNDGARSLEKCWEMDRMTEVNGMHRFEWTHKNKEGKPIPVEVTGSALTIAEKPVILVHWRDLTLEKARLAAANMAKEKALEEARRKSEILAVASHEIKNPLWAMLGTIDLLTDGSSGVDQAHLMRSLKYSAHSLDAVVRSYLDMTSIDADALHLNMSNVDLRQLLNELKDMFHFSASRRGIFIRTVFPSFLHPIVFTDADRLRQILVNLILNAVKSTVKGGVTISTMPATDGPHKTIIRISDTGVGMAADKIDALFTPFNNIEANLSPVPKGAGLGLSISRRLLEAMGGVLSVQSTLNIGTTIELRLP